MDKVYFQMIASVVMAVLFCLGTWKMLGAMQQSGYKNRSFWGWFTRKDNLFFNRIAVFSLCLALASAVTSLCFSFLGRRWALLCSALPILALCAALIWADRKYALKVQTKRTGRLLRLFVLFCLLTAAFSFGWCVVLGRLAEWNRSQLYGFIAYVPFAVVPLFLPVLLCLANGISGLFENARNKKFVKRAGQVLDESKILRIGVVGSYGKTSVKTILKTLLSEKYSVVETPQSYNTPMGIAKTVFSSEFADKQVFIAEMGARKKGDIAELCALVRPDYAIFTGVCPQHIGTFGSLEKVWAEKSEILRCGAKKVVCGEDLRSYVGEGQTESVLFAEKGGQNADFQDKKTVFTLSICGEQTTVEVPLLGEGSVENITLCVRLCELLGLTQEEIVQGISKLTPVPHRLQWIESNGVCILDDGYNGNPRGAKQAIDALCRFAGRKCVVTPGLVECGVLEEKLNGELGEEIARAHLDKVILVGDTLVGAVKEGYLAAEGDAERITTVKTLEGAKALLQGWLQTGDTVLFLNDLPDVY